jgi:hypothetical protein
MPLNNELFVLHGVEGVGEIGGSGGEAGEGEKGPDQADSLKPLKGAELDRQFARVWSVYPQAVERPKARAMFARQKPTAQLVDAMLEAITQQQHGEQWQKGYIPKLATWLEGRRWEDRIEHRPTMNPRTAATLGAAQRFAERRRPTQE